METDYDYLRTGTPIGFRASRELCSNYLLFVFKVVVVVTVIAVVVVVVAIVVVVSLVVIVNECEYEDRHFPKQ